MSTRDPARTSTYHNSAWLNLCGCGDSDRSEWFRSSWSQHSGDRTLVTINKPRYGKVDYAAILREGWKSCIDAFALTGSIVGILIGATCFAFILRELGGDKLIQYGWKAFLLAPLV